MHESRSESRLRVGGWTVCLCDSGSYFEYSSQTRRGNKTTAAGAGGNVTFWTLKSTLASATKAIPPLRGARAYHSRSALAAISTISSKTTNVSLSPRSIASGASVAFLHYGDQCVDEYLDRPLAFATQHLKISIPPHVHYAPLTSDPSGSSATGRIGWSFFCCSEARI
jgi:hypothetical protein